MLHTKPLQQCGSWYPPRRVWSCGVQRGVKQKLPLCTPVVIAMCRCTVAKDGAIPSSKQRAEAHRSLRRATPVRWTISHHRNTTWCGMSCGRCNSHTRITTRACSGQSPMWRMQ
jgi:hypothetical protein